MTLSIEEVLRWQPDKLSEDHLDNFILRTVKNTDIWEQAYYNPPHGSWKFISIYKDNFEYRQVGPKRGVGKIRRPDIAFQRKNTSEVILWLIESKINKSDWFIETPELMRCYFEGSPELEESEGVRSLPFRHKKRKNTHYWEEISEDDTDRFWFREIDVSYVFGFMYSLGLITERFSHERELDWINTQNSEMNKANIPIIFLAVGWKKDDFKPLCIFEFNDYFPNERKREIIRMLEPYKMPTSRDLISYFKI